MELTAREGHIAGRLDAWGAEAWHPHTHGGQPLYPYLFGIE